MGLRGELAADDLLVSITPRRWSPAVFGVAPAGASRRRPRHVLRVLLAATVVADA